MQERPVDVLLSLGDTGGGALLILGGAALLGGLLYAGMLWLLRVLTRGTDWTLPLRGALLRRIQGPFVCSCRFCASMRRCPPFTGPYRPRHRRSSPRDSASFS